MVMPAALDRYYTREEVLAFPQDGNRYELVHGELLVSPAPRAVHQTVVLNLAVALREYVRRHGIGQVFIAPADISFGGLDDVLVQPDVFAVGPEYRDEEEWDAIRTLTLVAEVLSPTSARFDRFTKRRLYQEQQVPLYWIVDPGTRRAEVWTPGATAPAFEMDHLIWHPALAPEPLVLGLEELLES